MSQHKVKVKGLASRTVHEKLYVNLTLLDLIKVNLSFDS